MYDIFVDFLNKARVSGKFESSASKLSQGVKYFYFYFNMGDVLIPQDPQKAWELVLFAQQHAKLQGGSQYEINTGYGLLDMSASDNQFNEERNLIHFDFHRGNEFFTLREWLEMNGFTVTPA